MRILRRSDGATYSMGGSTIRELIAATETDGRWGLVEVTAEPSETVGTHLHRGEP